MGNRKPTRPLKELEERFNEPGLKFITITPPAKPTPPATPAPKEGK